MSQTAASPSLPTIAFIGGGNMASAIIGGLIHQGLPASQIEVVEPWAEAREALRKNYGIEAQAEAGPALQRAGIVVWAVKPQTFKDAAAQAKAHTQAALHLSVAAGIRSDSIAQWLGSERVVRTMPNTPALVGKGMSALYARPAVTAAERQSVEAIMAYRRVPVGGKRKAARRRHGPLRLWPSVRFLLPRSHDPRGRGHGPKRTAGTPAGRRHICRRVGTGPPL